MLSHAVSASSPYEGRTRLLATRTKPIQPQRAPSKRPRSEKQEVAGGERGGEGSRGGEKKEEEEEEVRTEERGKDGEERRGERMCWSDQGLDSSSCRTLFNMNCEGSCQ